MNRIGFMIPTVAVLGLALLVYLGLNPPYKEAPLDRTCVDGFLVTTRDFGTTFCRTRVSRSYSFKGCENAYSDPSYTVELYINGNAQVLPTKCYNELHKEKK